MSVLVATAEEDQPLAQDKIDLISDWLSSVQDSLHKEEISYGELMDIDTVYDHIKDMY